MEEKEFLPGYKSYEEYSNDLFEKITCAIKISQKIPTGVDYAYSTTLEDAKKKLESLGHNILGLIQCIIDNRVEDGPKLDTDLDDDDYSDRFESIVQVNDNLLEKAAIIIDYIKGDMKEQLLEPVVKQKSTTPVRFPSFFPLFFSDSFLKYNFNVKRGQRVDYHIYSAKNILRPQLKFEEMINNDAKDPFIPKIFDKPNAMVPLDKSNHQFSSPKLC